jgi:predicted AAA+ superfamily ATPase
MYVYFGNDSILSMFMLFLKVMIKRLQIDFARDRLFRGKALIIFGPRQAGKTTFCEQLLEKVARPTLRLNGDDSDTRELLSKPNVSVLKNLIGKNEILFIDEAQRIPDVGLAIKIVVDQMKDVQVIATGSSSFELAGHINEPLTGRKYEMRLYPLAYSELVEDTNFLTEKRNLEMRMIYGSYPEIVTDPENAEEHLKLIADSYLYKDLFALEKLNKPQLLEKIVKALALQVGSEVNYNEVSRLVGADVKTVEKYITLLEQAFVVFTLPALSRNVRNEIKKGRKIYFYDNGIINAVTNNFKMLRNRKDVGSLWENYLISERAKTLQLKNLRAKKYFWRTTQQQEIDYIEESQEQMLAAEFKWNPAKVNQFSKTFLNAYPEAITQFVTPENYFEFIGKQIN